MNEERIHEELGPALGWTPAQTPPMTTLFGEYVRLEKLDPEKHTDALYNAQSGPDSDGRTWLYMGRGPFPDLDSFREYIEQMAASSDPAAYAVIPTDGEAAGIVTYLRINEQHGSIEIGHIWYGASIQRTPVTTEVVYLAAKHVFEDLGYRRFEWKCYATNERSKRAALRLGFTYEGTFRNHLVVRDRNRDTAWFAMTIEDWPRIKAAFEAWLDPSNFDVSGQQKQSLTSLRER